MPTDPFAAFRVAVEARDVEAAVQLFAADCTFLSPIVREPYRGTGPLRAILSGVMSVVEDFRYTASCGQHPRAEPRLR
ncbi:nuclear transport factor 2 family protein [Blastococcus sp. HT6-30]|uniref:nuclear transport factor 2 family protein n=1 Tax=Blastococcus sp. HT6-30 TaxID=3144843 RepID=UPI00321B1F33